MLGLAIRFGFLSGGFVCGIQRSDSLGRDDRLLNLVLHILIFILGGKLASPTCRSDLLANKFHRFLGPPHVFESGLLPVWNRFRVADDLEDVFVDFTLLQIFLKQLLNS